MNIIKKVFQMTLGLITVVSVISYTLAVVFAPFGIVWLVLAH